MALDYTYIYIQLFAWMVTSTIESMHKSLLLFLHFQRSFYEFLRTIWNRIHFSANICKSNVKDKITTNTERLYGMRNKLIVYVFMRLINCQIDMWRDWRAARLFRAKCVWLPFDWWWHCACIHVIHIEIERFCVYGVVLFQILINSTKQIVANSIENIYRDAEWNTINWYEKMQHEC